MFIFACIMEQQYIKKTNELLQTADNVVITCHKNPDGDAIGSSLALYGYLKRLNITAQVIIPNDYPDFLKWLPYTETILIFEEAQEKCSELIKNADLIFSLDYNALHRTGEMQPVLEKSEAAFIMIDHHQQPDGFAIVTYSDTRICSTCQMVYHFIESLGDTSFINADIASEFSISRARLDLQNPSYSINIPNISDIKIDQKR